MIFNKLYVGLKAVKGELKASLDKPNIQRTRRGDASVYSVHLRFFNFSVISGRVVELSDRARQADDLTNIIAIVLTL